MKARTAAQGSKTTTDRLGIMASALCAIHCAAGALLIGVAGAGRLFLDERIEVGFAVVAVTLVVAALASGFRAHGVRLPMALGAVGIALLAVSHSIEFDVAWAEPGLSICGAAFLISAHGSNLWAHHRQSECCATEAVSA